MEVLGFLLVAGLFGWLIWPTGRAGCAYYNMEDE